MSPCQVDGFTGATESCPVYERLFSVYSVLSDAWLLYHYDSVSMTSSGGGGVVSRWWDLSWAPFVSTPPNDDNQTLYGRRRRRRLEQVDSGPFVLPDTTADPLDLHRRVPAGRIEQFDVERIGWQLPRSPTRRHADTLATNVGQGQESLFAGLRDVQFGNDTCFQVAGFTDHDWGNETLYLSFVTPSEVESYQVLYYERPLVVALLDGLITAVVYPGKDQDSRQRMSYNALPVKPDTYYSMFLVLDGWESTASLVLNGELSQYVFPDLNPGASVEAGEVASGPLLFAKHQGPIYLGCQAEEVSSKFGGTGGSQQGSFTCADGSVLSQLDVNYAEEAGSSLQSIRATCTNGASSVWFGSTPDQFNASLTGLGTRLHSSVHNVLVWFLAFLSCFSFFLSLSIFFLSFSLSLSLSLCLSVSLSLCLSVSLSLSLSLNHSSPLFQFAFCGLCDSIRCCFMCRSSHQHNGPIRRPSEQIKHPEWFCCGRGGASDRFFSFHHVTGL